MLYGRSEIVNASLQRKLKEEPPIKPNNLESVIRLALAVQNYCATMMSVGLQEYLNDFSLLSDLVAKLPSDLKLDWGRHSLAAGAANLTTFDKWLFGIAICATIVAPYECHSTEKDKTSMDVRYCTTCYCIIRILRLTARFVMTRRTFLEKPASLTPASQRFSFMRNQQQTLFSVIYQ